MHQKISMVCLNERVPIPRYFTPSDFRSLVGERYGAAGDLIVREKAGNEVTVITTGESSPGVDESNKALLKGKKISIRVAYRRELHRLITKIHDIFGFIH